MTTLVPVARALRSISFRVPLIPGKGGPYDPYDPDGILKSVISGDLVAQLGPNARLLIEVDTATRTFVHTLVQTDLLGTDVTALVSDYFEDCGNGRWPLPRKWFKPGWLLPEPGRVDDAGKPQPDPWLTRQMQVVVALVLTDLGDQLDSDLGTTLVEGAGRLFDLATTDPR